VGALTCSLVALLLAGTGAGTKYMETTLQDDASFLHRPAAVVRRYARQIAALGADRLRLTASWSSIAPRARTLRVPHAPFDSADSRTYPTDAWQPLDTAVRAADDAGLKVQIDLAFWAPRWAVRRPSKNPVRQRYAPDPRLFAEFARAAASRYSGGFPDPQNPRRPLPAVHMWTTWNEPNHPSFLAPQWIADGHGGFRPESPHIYRAMHNAAYDAIKDVGGAGETVLVGGTTSQGSSVPGKGGVPPLAFARALACVDDRLQPLNVPECANFQPIKADGWAHHPYSRAVTPGTSDPFADDAPIADVSRLSSLLDRLAAAGRIATRLPIYDTEYGYESSPDDPFQPFTRLQQAQFMGWSTYLAWRDPDTRMFAQFLLRDVDPRESGRRANTRGYYRDWQSGLFTADGVAKPALDAFKLPFWAQMQEVAGIPTVLFFGQVRPGKGRQMVRLERQDPQSGVWEPQNTLGINCSPTDQIFLTNTAGFFLRTAPGGGAGTYRFSWRNQDGNWESSVPVPVAADAKQPPPL
jgi:hypothetical protein